MTKVSTSILTLSEDDYVHSFYNLETAKTDYFHIDVMDGKFVKANTVNRMKEYVNALSHITNLGIDVHLMVENVEEFVDEFIYYEPTIITFHYEAIGDSDRVFDIIDDIKRNDVKVGIAINPETDIKDIEKYLPFIHMVNIMGVHPGEGGQEYIPQTTSKIKALADYINEHDLNVDIEVDGGINEKTCKDAVSAGANILVSGAYILNSDDAKKAINNLKMV